jgi:ComF family protein
MHIHHLIDSTLSLLFPPRCAACNLLLSPGESFCEPCRLTFEPIRTACRKCGLPTFGVSVDACIGCLIRPRLFARARAPFIYGGAIAVAIRRFKWGGASELESPLGELLAAHCRAPKGLVIPVPLHPRRLRERGFNQAARLARRIANGNLLFALERVRDTPSQSRLGDREREKNVRGAFRVRRPEVVRGQSVLVVDDVLTTGATAEACSRALLTAGAREIEVLTLARAI